MNKGGKHNYNNNVVTRLCQSVFFPNPRAFYSRNLRLARRNCIRAPVKLHLLQKIFESEPRHVFASARRQGRRQIGIDGFP